MIPLPAKSSSLPRKLERSSSLEEQDPEFGAILRGMRILLAEDNVVNQKVACQQLKKFGTQVKVVNDGQQCLEALEGHRDDYDLILMDVQVRCLCQFFLFELYFHGNRRLHLSTFVLESVVKVYNCWCTLYRSTYVADCWQLVILMLDGGDGPILCRPSEGHT